VGPDTSNSKHRRELTLIARASDDLSDGPPIWR
jgi:hypothetical protein